LFDTVDSGKTAFMVTGSKYDILKIIEGIQIKRVEFIDL
jgi:hypothetical protein